VLETLKDFSGREKENLRNLPVDLWTFYDFLLFSGGFLRQRLHGVGRLGLELAGIWFRR
jgi:hypothetical protein